MTYKVNLKYFASIREAIGQGSESVSTQAATLKDLRDELIARGGAYAEVLAHGRAVRMALNQDLCEDTAMLSNGCEVAFFPPVTGG
jgi:molybdopterin synthase sulfur carrier subunit